MDDRLSLENPTSKIRLKIVGLLLAGLTAFFLIAQYCDTSLSADNVEKKIMSSERLQRVNILCEELPKPSDFIFVYKSIGGNTFTRSLGFHFSSKLKIGEVKQFYTSWFETKNWRVDESNSDLSQGYFSFQFNKNRISIENGPFNNSNYSITCSEED